MPRATTTDPEHWVRQAYVFALDPTPAQQRAFASHASGARYAYNWGVATIAAALDARAAQVAAGEKPTVTIPKHFELCKQWTEFKNDPANQLGWVSENSSGTYQAALRDAAAAWQVFFDSRRGRRAGRRVGRPKFKAKGKARDSFQLHGSPLAVAGPHHVMLPKIGLVKTHEPTRKLLRRLKAGRARLIRATISRTASGWQVALTVTLERQVRVKPSARQRTGGLIGVSLGAQPVVTLSTGKAYPLHPRPLESQLRRLACAQRVVARRQPGSNRHRKAVARVARIHKRIADLRRDLTEKLTSELVHTHAVIALQDWDVQAATRRGRGPVRRAVAVRNRRLLDAAPGMIRWQLTHKAAWYGAKVVVVDRSVPVAQICSACGVARAKLRPDQRLFRCQACGLCLDRAVNAARNVASVAARQLAGLREQGVQDDAGSGPESRNARGGAVRPGTVRRGGRASVKREASTGLVPGKWGTPGG